MDEALKKYSDGSFPEPPLEDLSDLKPVLRGIWQGGTTYSIDKSSGKLASEFTPEELREEKVVSEVHTILHWVDKDNPRGPAPERPESDSQYKNWEYGVLRWKEQNRIRDGSVSEIPTEADTSHRPGLVEVTITNPSSGSTYGKNAMVRVTLSSKSRSSLDKVDYYINGKFAGTVSSAPFSLSFVPSDIGLASGSHTLRVVGFDNIANRGEDEVRFRVD